MNKITRLILFLAVVIMTTAVYAQSETDSGITTDELVRLANYAPEDTQLFLTIRSDEAYINKLDAFVSIIQDHVGMGGEDAQIPSFFHNLFATPFYGNSEGVDTWMGERAALSLTSLDTVLGNSSSTTIPVVIFEITDKESADAYISDAYTNTWRNLTHERTVREDGIIHYAITEYTDDAFYIQITDELIVISSEFDYLGTLPETRLSEAEIFTGLIGQLPTDSYDALGYLSPDLLFEAYNDMLYGVSDAYDEYHLSNFTDIQELAFAINIYNDSVLTFDMVSYSENLPEFNTIDRDLIRFVPSNALFYAHNTSLGQSFAQYNQQFDIAFKQLETFGAGIEDEIPFDIKHLVTFLDLTFKGTTGIRAEEFAEGLNSDWLFYVSSVGNTANFLTIIRSSDTDKTEPVFDHLMDVISDTFANTVEEDDILKLAIPVNPLFGDQEIWFGENDDLFVIGTQHDFKFDPDPTSVTLNTRAHYNAASAYFLEDPNAIFYLNMTQVRSLLDVIRQRSNPSDQREITSVIEFLNMFESISSTSSQHDSYITARMTISLSQPATP